MNGGDEGPWAAFAGEEARDARRLRRAAVAAVGLHLVLLALPRPVAHPRPGAPPAGAAAFALHSFRLAPPAPPPEPALPAPEPPPAAPPAAAAGAPPAAAPRAASVEILFAEGEDSRLVPPRPLATPAPRRPARAPAGRPDAVRLLLRLDAAGSVLDVRVEAGEEPFASAAVAAARGWLFLPATLDGAPLPVVFEVVVRFPPEEGAGPPPAPPVDGGGGAQPPSAPADGRARSAPTAAARSGSPSRSSRRSNPRWMSRGRKGPAKTRAV